MLYWPEYVAIDILTCIVDISDQQRPYIPTIPVSVRRPSPTMTSMVSESVATILCTAKQTRFVIENLSYREVRFYVFFPPSTLLTIAVSLISMAWALLSLRVATAKQPRPRANPRPNLRESRF